MKYILIFFLLFASPALAANVNIDALPAAASVGGTDLLECEQVGINRKCTAAQTAAYVNSLFSADATVAAGGVITFATVNSNIGSFGSTTQCTSITVNAKGLITAASQAACAPPFSAVTGRTTLAQLPQGIANSIWINPTGSTADMQNVAVPACANDGVHALVYVNATGLVCSALTTGGAGTVTSITPGAGLVSGITASCTQTAITVTGTLSGAECLNAQTGTSYAILDTDRGKLITGTNAAAQAFSIAQAGAASAFANGWYTDIYNKGVGTLTITPTISTINGAATYALFAGNGIKLISDGTNYQIQPGTAGGITVSSQTGANYAFVASDFAKLVNLSNASNQIPTIAVASALGANWYVQVCNQGAGTQTITPTTSTIGGAATYVLRAASAAAPVCVGIVSDGTNYQIIPDAQLGTLSGAVKASGGQLSQAACADLSNGTALCSTTPGTGVATAAAAALSAAGGLTSTIASGTSALGTGAITSATCATVVTTAATNTATTDVVSWGFNGDPTAVTGYAPLVAGMLTIIAYPSANNVNFKVCNNTSSSVTPGAITLNWRTVR